MQYFFRRDGVGISSLFRLMESKKQVSRINISSRMLYLASAWPSDFTSRDTLQDMHQLAMQMQASKGSIRSSLGCVRHAALTQLAWNCHAQLPQCVLTMYLLCFGVRCALSPLFPAAQVTSQEEKNGGWKVSPCPSEAAFLSLQCTPKSHQIAK